MLNKGLTAFVTVAVIAMMASPLAAETRSKRTNTYRQYQNYDQYYGDQQYTTGRARSRPDPSSYDGRRTGNPRTCGSDFFRYDIEGVPVGPYCD